MKKVVRAVSLMLLMSAVLLEMRLPRKMKTLSGKALFADV